MIRCYGAKRALGSSARSDMPQERYLTSAELKGARNGALCLGA